MDLGGHHKTRLPNAAGPQGLCSPGSRTSLGPAGYGNPTLAIVGKCLIEDPCRRMLLASPPMERWFRDTDQGD
jgi:hypothetical protein